MQARPCVSCQPPAGGVCSKRSAVTTSGCCDVLVRVLCAMCCVSVVCFME
jgi:hypothetical protein